MVAIVMVLSIRTDWTAEENLKTILEHFDACDDDDFSYFISGHFTAEQLDAGLKENAEGRAFRLEQLKDAIAEGILPKDENDPRHCLYASTQRNRLHEAGISLPDFTLLD